MSVLRSPAVAAARMLANWPGRCDTPLLMLDPAVAIAVLVVVAVGATWLAEKARIPSILALLTVGVLAGPVFGWLDPDALLGDLVAPLVSLAVGVILFEGGLSLRLREIEGQQRVIWLLVTAGVLVTWMVGSIAAFVFTDLDGAGSILLGSILVVSGPTVVGPVLRSVRPNRRVASILKWESIFVDLVGAMVAVLTFDIVLSGAQDAGFGAILGEVLRFVGAGVVAGLVMAVLTIFALRRHWVPEHLLSLVGLAAALAAFTIANAFAHESGLVATAVLGLALSNHRPVRTEQILRFSEVIRVLLIGLLFIVLSARLTRDQIGSLGWGAVGLVLALIVVGRPLAVWVSTLGSPLKRAEQFLLAGVMPRGIVAASIASVFALQLEAEGVAGATLITPLTFAVIVATVVVYGLGAGPLARRLGLAAKTLSGVLIVGAGRMERAIASALAKSGIDVILATTNRNDEYRARMEGLRTFYGNVLDDDIDLRLDLFGMGRLLALTPNDEVNTLAALRFADVFGGAGTYQLPAAPPPPGVEGTVADIGGRPLFGDGLHYSALSSRFSEGARLTQITDTFTVDQLIEQEGGVFPLFLVRGSRVIVGTVGRKLLNEAQLGDYVIWVPGEKTTSTKTSTT